MGAGMFQEKLGQADSEDRSLSRRKPGKQIPWSARSLSPRRRGCQGSMRIISFIEDPSVIRDILNHLGLWLARARPPPKAHALPIREYAAVDLQLQTPADTIYGDPEYTWDEYIRS